MNGAGAISLREGGIVAWSGNAIAVRGRDGSVRNGKEFEGAINDVALAQDKLVILVDKKVYLAKLADFEVVKSAEVVRRPSCCRVFGDECFIADKSGDVYVFHLTDDAKHRLDEPILGHVSLILAIDVTEKYIITAEQDEKVKISSRRNPFVIDRYLLGHTEFVNSVGVDRTGTIFTASGDGTVRTWAGNDETGKLDFGEQNVAHSMSLGEERLAFALCPAEQGQGESLLVRCGLDLAVKFKHQLRLGQIPVASCPVGDEFYWLIENEEKEIDLYRMDAADTVVQIAANIGQSKRDPDKWTKLRKIVEKSEAYDQYLLQREKGFKNCRHSRKKKRKVDQSPVPENAS